MDILNFISWIRGGRQVTKIDPSRTLLPVGLKDGRRDDGYLAGAISVEDLAKYVNSSVSGNCPMQMNFKPGSVGEKVSFRKISGSDPTTNKDIILPGFLEITRGNGGGGIYNIALQSQFNNGGPENTFWNTQYLDPTNINWAPLWDLQSRNYESWRNAIQVPNDDNDPAPPQYVGMPTVMKYDDGVELPRYWLIMFTHWGVGNNDDYGFAYDRWEIHEPVYFEKPDFQTSTVDIISDGVRLARNNNGGLYNALNETNSEQGASPENTRWNSIYVDGRPGYSGWDDLSNLESRVYSSFVDALDNQVGNNIETALVMHDLTTDLYYKISFQQWSIGQNEGGTGGGGFAYIRTVIPQSCGIKFADGTIMTTASTSGESTCCPVLDAEGNLIIDDNSANIVNIGPGGTHLIPNFSGFLLVNDHFDGGVETWIAGGGDTICLGATNTGGGPVGSTLAISGNGYEWTNASNMNGPFTFTVIKTRNEA